MEEFFNKIMSWIEGFLDWLIDLLLYIPKVVFHDGLVALAEWFSGLSAPSFFVIDWGSISGGVYWFASVAQLHVGIPLVLGALLLRFLLRRIPLIG